MSIVIQVAPRDSAKAWSVLVRHSAGTAPPNRTFIVSEEAVRALRDAGVRFTQVTNDADVAGAAAGERI